MAFRMQTAVPEILDVSKEPDDIVKMYGPECLVPGTFAANCLLARKLSENGVRFVQLYHQGWDQHGNLPFEIARQAKDVDQASAALVTDLKNRGLLDETLVIWGGEFGRTSYTQGELTKDNYGRDHHPRELWQADGAVPAQRNGSHASRASAALDLRAAISPDARARARRPRADRDGDVPHREDGGENEPQDQEGCD